MPQNTVYMDLIKYQVQLLYLGKMNINIDAIYLVYILLLLCGIFISIYFACHIFACFIYSSHAQNVNEVVLGQREEVECQGEGKRRNYC